MPRAREIFVCRSCGGAQHRWMGKCPDCGAWDALHPERLDPAAEADPQKSLVGAWNGDDADSPSNAAQTLAQAAAIDPAATRLETGIAELDRVLGGGVVPGSLVLLGGPPGIGKSTLMLQAAAALARSQRVMYVSSEESAHQVARRAQRVLAEHADAIGSSLFLLADTNLARIVEQARRVGPAILVIDSIQMIYKSDVPASPGSVAQVRRCGSELAFLSKAAGVAVVLVGHVTKDGHLAGPRLLEHLVDVVLGFDGERSHAHRVLRAAKNRFGTTQEIGIFEMTASGLREAPEGAGIPAGQDASPRPGSVICPVATGTRTLLVEIQALTATGFLGAAKRKCSGLDPNRLAMIIAVLEQHAELRLADRDVFASAVGGIRVVEPAADLALLLAIAGAHHRRSMPTRTCALGEVGLGGEVRSVTGVGQRVREAGRLGYARVLIPRPRTAEREELKSTKPPGVEVVPIAGIAQAIEHLS